MQTSPTTRQRIAPATLITMMVMLALAPFAGCGDDGAGIGTDVDDDDAAGTFDVLPGADSADTAGTEDTGPAGGGGEETATGDEETTEPDPDPVPGLGLDYDTISEGAIPRWEPDVDEWTAIPWPSDRRMTAEGAPDLSNFPNPGIDMLGAYVDLGHEVLGGWGLNGSTYFQFDVAIDTDALPVAADSAQDRKSVIQMFNASQGTDRYGETLPLVFQHYTDGDDPYYLDNTLAVRPVFGFPLAENETYCVVVTRGVLDVNGDHVAPAPGFLADLHNQPSLAPLVAWLPGSMLLEEDLAAATCFTTDTPTFELRDVHAWLQNQTPPTPSTLDYKGKANVFHEFQGTYPTPNFQTGEKPYEEAGGDLKFDAAGDPIVVLDEEIRFLLMVPAAFAMPPEGWPVVLYAHGTTGDVFSCKSPVLGADSVAEALLKEGMAMICIDQPLHGDRGEAGWFLELLTFNFFNPRAGRTNFRQSAIDTMVLTRMLAEGALDIPVDTTAFADEVRFDATQIHFFGHSQGGLSGALAIGVEPLINSAVLSGAGGVLVETILRRKDFIDIAASVTSLLDIPPGGLDTFHPTMSVVQLLVDATDPVNYAQYWINPATGGTPKHVFLTEGLLDEATPSIVTDILAASARIPLVAPVAAVSVAHNLRGLTALQPPVGQNLVNSKGQVITAGLRQWAGEDHFVAFTNGEARSMWRNWFKALRIGDIPQISP